MTGNEARRRPSLLARLLGRRSADRATGETAASAGSQPPLLDQVSSGQLTRLGADRLGPEIHLRAEGTAATGRKRPGSRRSVGRRLLAPAFLGLGLVMVAGLSFGTVSALTDEGGVSTIDVLRLAVMGLVSLTVAGQAFAVFRSLPGGRWLAARASRPWQRLVGLLTRAEAADAAPAAPAPLLDQVSTTQLRGLAPQRLGEGSAVASVARRGQRFAGAGGWFILVLALMGVLALAAAGLAFAVVRSLTADGGFGIGVVLQVAFLGMMSMAVLFLGVTALRSLSDTRRRRPIRLLRRLLRYLLRWFDRGRSAAGRAWAGALGGGSVPLRLAVTALAAGTVAALGFAPSLMEAGGDDGAASAAGRSPTPAVAGAAAAPKPTPTSAPEPTPTPEVTPASGATPTPALTSTRTPPPTRTPAPRTTPSPTLAPTAAPAPTPTPTPRPQKVTLLATADSWVDRQNPRSTSGGSDTTLWVVDYTKPRTARSFVRFSLSSIRSSATISQATLRLFYRDCDFGPAKVDVGVYQVTSPWAESTLSWSGQPSFSGVTKDVVSLGCAGATGAYVEWDITGLVRAWVSGSAPNRGMVVKATSETGASSRLLAGFGSRERKLGGQPQLVVSYVE